MPDFWHIQSQLKVFHGSTCAESEFNLLAKSRHDHVSHVPYQSTLNQKMESTLIKKNKDWDVKDSIKLKQRVYQIKQPGLTQQES